MDQTLHGRMHWWARRVSTSSDWRRISIRAWPHRWLKCCFRRTSGVTSTSTTSSPWRQSQQEDLLSFLHLRIRSARQSSLRRMRQRLCRMVHTLCSMVKKKKKRVNSEQETRFLNKKMTHPFVVYQFQNQSLSHLRHRHLHLNKEMNHQHLLETSPMRRSQNLWSQLHRHRSHRQRLHLESSNNHHDHHHRARQGACEKCESWSHINYDRWFSTTPRWRRTWKWCWLRRRNHSRNPMWSGSSMLVWAGSPRRWMIWGNKDSTWRQRNSVWLPGGTSLREVTSWSCWGDFEMKNPTKFSWARNASFEFSAGAGRLEECRGQGEADCEKAAEPRHPPHVHGSGLSSPMEVLPPRSYWTPMDKSSVEHKGMEQAEWVAN